MQNDQFADILVRASKAEGSLLALGMRLGVAPALLYRWIAQTERPSEEQRRELEKALAG